MFCDISHKAEENQQQHWTSIGRVILDTTEGFSTARPTCPQSNSDKSRQDIQSPFEHLDFLSTGGGWGWGSVFLVVFTYYRANTTGYKDK